MIEYAVKRDYNEIKALFDVCFPQEPDFNRWFFNNVYKSENTIVYRIDGKIAAMLQAIPYTHSALGNITYIYGACTKAEYRKKGLMRELLKYSFKEDLRLGRNASALIPQNKELFAFYEKFGYKAAFFINDNIGKAEDYNGIKGKFELKKANEEYAAKMAEIYDTALINREYILRNTGYFEIQLKMFEAFGGNAFIYTQGGETVGYCFVNMGEIPFAQEIITVNDEIYMQEFKAALFNALGCKKIRFVTKDGEKPMGCIKLYGAEGGSCRKGYMGLMFD